jgi:pSer/pThr/pTyr-binding forkhead associated (FHA) protein
VETVNSPPEPGFDLAELVLVDCLDNRGRVQFRERFALGDGRRTFVIGRSVNADVTVDDDHVAPLHASVEVTTDGRLLARDLGTLNGIIVAGKRHHAVADGAGVSLDDGRLQVGRTHVRVRASSQPLAPERSDQPGRTSLLDNPARLAGLGALAVVAQSVYDAWLGAPRDLLGSTVTTLGVAVIVTAAWVAVWALLSRIMQDDWRWLRHAAIILCVSAVVVAVDGLLDLGWFAFSLPPSGARGRWLGAVALAAALTLHLIHASGLSARRAALIGCLVPALLGAAGQWMVWRSQSRDVNHIDANLRLYPPGLRLRPAGSVGDYFAGAGALRKAADAKLKSAPAEDAETYD